VFFPLHPDTPPEGRSLAALFAGQRVDLAGMHQHLADLMRAEGLPYGARTHTYNSRLAQELGKWVETEAKTARDGDAGIVGRVHDALYRAYFVEGRNIGDTEELVTIADTLGLPGSIVREMLTARRMRDAVDADWVYSRRSGVTGVPTFLAGGRTVVGAQPYEVLEQLVMAAGATRR